MNSDGLALLVVLGLGGFVLWYLTRPSDAPLVKKEAPCSISGSYGGVGVGLTCGALEKGAKILTKGAGLATCAIFGACGKTATPEEAEKARVAASVTGCGGWKGKCLSPLNNETQVSQKPLIPVGKPPGFR